MNSDTKCLSQEKAIDIMGNLAIATSEDKKERAVIFIKNPKNKCIFKSKDIVGQQSIAMPSASEYIDIPHEDRLEFKKNNVLEFHSHYEPERFPNPRHFLWDYPHTMCISSPGHEKGRFVIRCFDTHKLSDTDVSQIKSSINKLEEIQTSIGKPPDEITMTGHDARTIESDYKKLVGEKNYKGYVIAKHKGISREAVSRLSFFENY